MKALLFTILSTFILSQAQSQQLYSIRQDPDNPKRKIVDIKPAVRKAPMIVQRGNMLTTAVKRPALRYDSFTMVHPKTGRQLDPNKTMTIKFNDSVTKTMTVKEYYDQVNELERQLTLGGRSLRIPATLADLKENFIPASYQQQPKMGFGFKSAGFKTNSNPSPSYNAKTGLPIQSKFITGNMSVGTNTFNVIPWEPALFIAASTADQGTPEFPAKWVTQSNIIPGRNTFPVILAVPSGYSGLVKRIDWLVSTQPFDETLVDPNPPGVMLGSTIMNPQFTNSILGLDIIPNAMNNKYVYFTVNLGAKAGPPPAQPKLYFIRTMEYDAAGELLKISPQVAAVYGGTAKELKVAWPETNTVPTFNYSYPPDASVPFGLYVRGSGFSTNKHRFWKNDTDKYMTTDGFSFKASATLGLRYFNFMSIVDANAPRSKELNIISASFVAGSGVGIPPYEQGVKLSLNILDGFMKPEIDFAAQAGGSTSIPINHTIKQPMDWEILSTRFFIGPVPFRITAKVGGEAGIELSGNVNTTTFDFQGSIRPYLKTYFTASGGVDAVIAYATLNAEVNPLLEISMPVKFSSSGQALTFSNNIAGLYGRVYLAVGFYYPCPSLSKIVGFLSGDDPLPLCECRWEWNIFDWKGFNESFNYESK